MIGKLLAWFLPANTTEHKYALLEMRVMCLEMENNRIRKMLEIQGESTLDSEDSKVVLYNSNFDTMVSKSVTSWLKNWLDDYDYSDSDTFGEKVESIIDDHDFTDSVSDAVDDAISNRDWDYEMRESIDWDKVADKVVNKIDWSDVISDNCLLTSDDIDLDDLLLKSEQLSEDETIKRGDLSDEISNDLKRDWFATMVAEIVDSEFQRSLGKARVNAQDNCQNAIDDEIQSAVAQRIESQMKQKFGDSWDNWFNENIRHTVTTVLGEMLEAAYEQTKKNTETDNNA